MEMRLSIVLIHNRDLFESTTFQLYISHLISYNVGVVHFLSYLNFIFSLKHPENKTTLH